MANLRDTLVTASVAAALVLAAGGVLNGTHAPATMANAASDAAQPSGETRLGTVDALIVLQGLWDRPALAAERQALETQLTTALTAKEAEVQSSQQGLQQLAQSAAARWQALPDGDPERTQIEAGYRMAESLHNQRVDAFQTLQADAQQQFDSQRADQMRACYAEIREAVAAIAGERGYTHVLSQAADPRQFEILGVDLLLQNIRDKPLVYGGEGDDITDAVLARLGVERPDFEALLQGGATPDGMAPDMMPAGPTIPTAPAGNP
ncbi:MAG: OmpH family outer membrane protein [Phycisphaerales bacterium]|nr:OmpH family outer membrane protein [Phycisphaerales bacterium]MCB9841127.1 OmpH family outer membrane protein [Phycisphaeraceae bacterium]